METGLISVIVPVYNLEKYILKGVQSLQRQSYSNLEVILIDDGSEDDTDKICKSICTLDKRFKYIRKNHEGASDARRTGMNMMNGEFVFFLDGDDYLENDTLKRLYDVLIKTYSDMCSCPFTFVHPDKSYSSDIWQYDYGTVVMQENKMEEYITKGLTIPLSGTLFRSRLFEKIELPKNRKYDDIYSIYRLIHYSERIAMTNCTTYFYVYRKESLSHDSFDGKELDMIDGLIERYSFIKIYYPHLEAESGREVYEATLICVNRLIKEKAIDIYRLKILQVIETIKITNVESHNLSDNNKKMIRILFEDLNKYILIAKLSMNISG